jgi:predicted acyltransferase (DUF342 family)
MNHDEIEQLAAALAAENGFVHGAATALMQCLTPELLIHLACREVARQGREVTAETVFANLHESMQNLILLAHADGPLPATVKVDL